MACIVLGTGDRVSVAAYVSGIKAVLAADPDSQYSASLEHWSPATAREICAQWRKSVHDRVNKRGGLHVPRDDVHDHAMRRLARMLADRAVVRPGDLAGVPKKVRARVAHRIHEEE